MKVTRVFLSAVLVVVCFCILQTAAGPFIQQVHEDQVKSEAPQINHHSTETSLEQRNPLALFRSKRQSHLSLCRYCCNCCHNKGCGFCCKF
ncbi:hepcidin-1 isoform X1 [Triplophysa dalaica]|uniref:hepcidin-1 isoform X1 n=1 Tax=Triplophysa dalaica TaxID=1582913 RepID=UPI0024DFAFF4|nr:hepcidin-1 isoform X1 [Triplophysa dalaica]